jgi:glucosamine 6-phosphate synthetase-like amidotransferase/phosphosugar isomerase protein
LIEKYGITPKSETDTEIVAIWIGVYLDEGLSLFESIKKSVEVLEGAYSFLLISTLDPEAMFIVKNTGTMVIGFPEMLKKQNATNDKLIRSSSIGSITSVDSKDGPEESHKFQIVASDTTVF